MKKRIQIIVQPVDNGYTIQAQSNDYPSGQNGKTVSLVATDETQVKIHIADFMVTAFAPTEPSTST